MINTEELSTDEQPPKREDLLAAYHNSYSMLSFEENVQQKREAGEYELHELPSYAEGESVLEAVAKKNRTRIKLPDQNSMLVDLGRRINLIGK